jgi:large subunit ribosomal protein L24
MKKEFSTAWKASSQPRKQRKFLAKAPLHIKRKQLSANLAKPLRSQYGRSLPVKKGDKVKIMRGKYKGKSGKITKVIVKRLKVYIDGIQTTKQDGSKAEVPIRASNLQITELNLEDKKRIKQKTGTPKKEVKSVTKENKK